MSSKLFIMASDFTDKFIMGVRDIEKAHSMQPADLCRVMQIESGLGTAPCNHYTRASGPIQFMPSVLTAVGWLGTPEDFAKVPLQDTIPYVRRYFARFGVLSTLADAYAAVFWPAAVGKPDDFEIAESHSIVYRYNAILDANGDGHLTKSDLDPACRRFLRGPRWTECLSAIIGRPVDVSAPVTSFNTVNWVQSKLLTLGYYHMGVDGIEGPGTVQAVRDFQASVSLPVDGIVGPNTMAKLRAA